VSSSKSTADVLIRQTKTAVFTAHRLIAWRLDPTSWPDARLAEPDEEFPNLVYERRITIVRSDAGADPILEQGKRVNVALAAPHFDGVVLARGVPLSFWRTLGRVSARRGYRYGMELRGGCIVPALGGGICLLSNALFEMAARLGWTILERHGHSMDAGIPVPGMWGLDATVVWPHVDLRVAPTTGRARLRVKVTGNELCLSVESGSPAVSDVLLSAVDDETQRSHRTNRIVRRIGAREEVLAVNRKRVLERTEPQKSCLTCDETTCKERVVVPSKNGART